MYFRHEVVVRRTRFELDKALKRAHILEGLLKAMDLIDEIVHIIRYEAKSIDEARQMLVDRYQFTDIQAAAIVEMRLRQLVGLEREKLQNEYDELMKFIERCNQILGSVEEQFKVVKDETMDLKARYGDPRRTEITLAEDEFNPEDFYADEDQVITISHLGYIKRTPLAEFRTQNRGGVGMKGSATRDEDFIEHIYIANTHSTMLLFTQKGKCYWLKVYEIPEGNRTSKGRAIQNILMIDPDDSVRAYLNVKTLKDALEVNDLLISVDAFSKEMQAKSTWGTATYNKECAQKKHDELKTSLTKLEEEMNYIYGLAQEDNDVLANYGIKEYDIEFS